MSLNVHRNFIFLGPDDLSPRNELQLYPPSSDRGQLIASSTFFPASKGLSVVNRRPELLRSTTCPLSGANGVPALDRVLDVKANRMPDVGTPIERLGQSYLPFTGIEVRELLIHQSSLEPAVPSGQYWQGDRRTR
jgi:hypothetical protein